MRSKPEIDRESGMGGNSGRTGPSGGVTTPSTPGGFLSFHNNYCGSHMWLLSTWDVASIPEELISPLPSDFLLNMYVAGRCYKF